MVWMAKCFSVTKVDMVGFWDPFGTPGFLQAGDNTSTAEGLRPSPSHLASDQQCSLFGAN